MYLLIATCGPVVCHICASCLPHVGHKWARQRPHVGQRCKEHVAHMYTCLKWELFQLPHEGLVWPTCGMFAGSTLTRSCDKHASCRRQRPVEWRLDTLKTPMAWQAVNNNYLTAPCLSYLALPGINPHNMTATKIDTHILCVSIWVAVRWSCRKKVGEIARSLWVVFKGLTLLSY